MSLEKNTMRELTTVEIQAVAGGASTDNVFSNTAFYGLGSLFNAILNYPGMQSIKEIVKQYIAPYFH